MRSSRASTCATAASTTTRLTVHWISQDRKPDRRLSRHKLRRRTNVDGQTVTSENHAYRKLCRQAPLWGKIITSVPGCRLDRYPRRNYAVEDALQVHLRQS